MSKPLKVVIGIPSGQYWNAKFGVDLVNLISYFSCHKVAGYSQQSLQVVNVRSSILPKNRMEIAKKALELQADYVLFLDTDHTFPKEMLHRMIGWQKPILAVNCVTKTIPAMPTARLRSTRMKTGDVVFSDAESSGVEQVWRVGTGVMLVETAVLAAVGFGAWEMKYLPEEETYQGEDWSFCAACEELGIPIYIDHDVSQAVGHEGGLVYNHDLVGSLQGA